MEKTTELNFPPVPQDKGFAEINFGNLFKEAMALDPSTTMEKADLPPAPTDKVVAEPPLPSIAEVKAKLEEKQADTQSKVEPTVTEPQADNKPNPEVREFRDDDLVRVKVDGEEKVVSYKDYKDGIQREAVFTKRMQSLSQQREAAERELAEKYSQLYQYAQAVAIAKQEIEQNSPLAKLAQHLEAQAKVPEQDPNTIATIGEIQKALKDHQAQMEERLVAERNASQQKLLQAAQMLQNQQVEAANAAKFNTALQSNPDLPVVMKAVPDPILADQIIRYKVVQMGPQTIEEGIEFANTIIKGWAEDLRAQQRQTNGKVEAERARAAIESPVGSPPAPQAPTPPQSFFNLKSGQTDWKGLKERALAMLET